MRDEFSQSRIQWQGDSWRLRVVDTPLPDGRSQEKGFIDHPGSVVLVPLQADQVVILRQYRLALDELVLELPAGTRRVNESWRQCAQRELREETGFRSDSLTPLGQVWPAPGITNELMAVYLAQDLAPDPLPLDADEEIEIERYPLKELVNMALDGRLQDAKSVVAILRTAAYLSELESRKH